MSSTLRDLKPEGTESLSLMESPPPHAASVTAMPTARRTARHERASR